jgi:hypothetical protein
MWVAVFRKAIKIVITENVMDTIGNQLRSMEAYATCIFFGLEGILFKNSDFITLLFALLVSCQLIGFISLTGLTGLTGPTSPTGSTSITDLT